MIKLEENKKASFEQEINEATIEAALAKWEAVELPKPTKKKDGIPQPKES